MPKNTTLLLVINILGEPTCSLWQSKNMFKNKFPEIGSVINGNNNVITRCWLHGGGLFEQNYNKETCGFLSKVHYAEPSPLSSISRKKNDFPQFRHHVTDTTPLLSTYASYLLKYWAPRYSLEALWLIV